MSTELDGTEDIVLEYASQPLCIEADAASDPATASPAPTPTPTPTPAPAATPEPFKTSSPVVRFLDSFLQEKNIKWLLGIGTLLVLGSSLRLVAAHWNEYPPVWKYLVFIAYTGAIFVAGEVSYWRLSLRKTGAGLMSLTVLLLPMTFLALHFVRPQGDFSLPDLLNNGLLLALVIGNFALSWFAARRIFVHFLRGSQPTFLASYLILGAAGAIVPALPGSWTPWIGLTLWAVLTAGVVKVNRHVFWLVEEHRLPRICGFFPIGLLTAQFVALAAIDLVRFVPEYLSIQWLGFATVLAAVPLLLATDALARVIEQRTGGLLRPLPASVVLPLGVGLLLVIAGVCLAGTGLPQAFALSPTALLAAGLLGLVAHRTQKTPLVWAMLIATIVAYNFSPVFFQSFARAVVQHGAAAVRESRLPYPFYGLTYLPLLAAMSVASGMLAKRGSLLFAAPLRQCAAGLSIALLAISCGHPKAMFPVSVVMTGMLACQTILFRDRRLMTPAIIALVMSGIGWTAFARDVLQFAVSEQMPYLALATVSALLLLPGRWFDRWSQSLPQRTSGSLDITLTTIERNLCQFCSAIVAIGATVLLLDRIALPAAHLFAPLTAFPYAAIACLCGLLLIHAVVWLAPMLGELALIVPVAFGYFCADWHAWSMAQVAAGATLIAFGFWLSSYLEQLAPRLRLSRAFARPANRLARGFLALLAGAYYGPWLFAAAVSHVDNFPWLLTLATVVCCFDAARRSGERLFSVLGCLGTLGLASAAVAGQLGVAQGAGWYPVAWSCVACLSLPWSVRERRRLKALLHTSQDRPLSATADAWRRVALIEPAYTIAIGVLCWTAIGTLVSISTAARVAGVVSLSGLWLTAVAERETHVWKYCLIISNWHLLALPLQACLPQGAWLWQLTLPELLACSIPFAMFAAGTQLIFQHPRLCANRPDETEIGLLELHRGVLKLLAGLALFGSMHRLGLGLGAADIAMAAATFVALAASELWQACRQQSEHRVWVTEGIVAASIGYFAAMGVIHFGHGWSMYIVLIAGLGAWGIGKLAAGHPLTAIMSRPMLLTGMALPLGTVAIGVGRHVLCPPSTWHGMNSLALLLAAGFYFWQGLERPDRRFVIVAAGIVNVALGLLWRELSWSDPQLFMIPAGVSILMLVELMKREVPQSLHNPLRYLGALVILVSPTFHIVGGSWLHLLTLMMASVAITLVSIGLRTRALMYTGTAFLVADLAAVIVRGSVDHPNILWLAGIALGGAVIGVAAVCENHREVLLQRVRLLAANIGAWE